MLISMCTLGKETFKGLRASRSLHWVTGLGMPKNMSTICLTKSLYKCKTLLQSRDISYRVKSELKLRNIPIDPRKFSQKY